MALLCKGVFQSNILFTTTVHKFPKKALELNSKEDDSNKGPCLRYGASVHLYLYG